MGKKQLNEDEKYIHMEAAEKVAEEIFRSLREKFNQEKMIVADCLHVGMVLSAYVIGMASKTSSFTKTEILQDFVEALTENVLETDFQMVSLN